MLGAATDGGDGGCIERSLWWPGFLSLSLNALFTLLTFMNIREINQDVITY
jgi:hypothetical protein